MSDAINFVRTATPRRRSRAASISVRATVDSSAVLLDIVHDSNCRRDAGATGGSDLQYHWHDQRAPLGLLRDVALQVSANLLFDHAVVGLFFVAGLLKRLRHDLARAVHESVFASCKSACDDFRGCFDPATQLVDRDD